MSIQHFRLAATGRGKGVLFGDVAALVRRFLETLRAIHPEFRHWESLGKARFEALDPQWRDLEAHLKAMVRPKKSERRHFSELDAAYDVTGATRSAQGFAFNLYSADADGSGGQAHARPDIVEMQLFFWADSCAVTMTFPPSRPDLVDPAVMRRVVDAVVKHWQPVKLELGSPELRERYLGDCGSRSQIEAGWFIYLRHGLLASCLPKNLPCPVETSPDGAMLFTLTPHVPDPDTAADVEKARALQQFFDQLHFDDDYMISGWPQDEAEDDYASQVTGAPHGRKYAVAFCAFDGYDAERDVLLFARLFRDRVGDIAHPYALEDAERRESLVFVVQARHQLAALDYAGVRAPIEWHIGIEQNARDLRSLLNEHAAIPVDRLRVVYTPFVP